MMETIPERRAGQQRENNRGIVMLSGHNAELSQRTTTSPEFSSLVKEYPRIVSPLRLSGSNISSTRQYCPPKSLDSTTKQLTFSKKRKHSSCFRRLHFQHDPVSRRIVRKVIYGRQQLTDEEKRAFWWDKQSLRKRVSHHIKMYRSKGQFAQLYHQAREMCSQHQDKPTLAEEITTVNVSDTPIRGLEQRLFPESASARQEVIRKVIAAQYKLPKHLSPEQQSKLLRAASQNLTRSSRMLARLYGIGDANVAATENI